MRSIGIRKPVARAQLVVCMWGLGVGGRRSRCRRNPGADTELFRMTED